MTLNKGDRVQWQEGGYGQYVCTGTIICEDRHQNGSNPLGFWTIQVDKQLWLRACHTAREMSSGWVSRSVQLNNLQLMNHTVA